MSARRRSARRASPALWAVAVVVIVSQAAAWLHAATPHVTCVEHGESIHIDVAPSAARLPARVPGRAVDAIDAAPSAPAAHAHDHCSLQASRAFASTAPARTVAPLPALPAPIAAAALPRPTRHLLFLAPKTSPPRAPVV